MIRKRFVIDGDGIVTDMTDLSMYIDNEDCCEKLNELNDENRQLKAKVNDKEVVIKVECEKLMQKILEVIDKKIEELEIDLNESIRVAMPTGALRGEIDLLEELREELQEND